VEEWNAIAILMAMLHEAEMVSSVAIHTRLEAEVAAANVDR